LNDEALTKKRGGIVPYAKDTSKRSPVCEKPISGVELGLGPGSYQINLTDKFDYKGQYASVFKSETKRGDNRSFADT
jgi:hypothetical protein